VSEVISRIPVAGPSITEVEVRAVLDAVTNGWYEGAGTHQGSFETAFADVVGRTHAIALPSCTSAIHLALLAHGVTTGDEVIVPESTWIASMAPITYVGATPVFVDVDEHTWCIDIDRVQAAITSRTKAIIAVDLYGSMPDLHALTALCDRHGVALIEDSAEALGSTWRSRPAGSFGDLSVFSFHGSKTLTTGEGGMLVTDDDAIAARVRFLADHGRHPGDRSFRTEEVAHKYKISALQCALGTAQLSRLAELVARKREIFGWYRDRLALIDGLSLNPDVPGLHNSYWMSTVILDEALGVDKVALASSLDRLGIATRPFFEPLSSLPAISKIGAARPESEHPVSTRLARTGLNLPSALVLDESDVERVCDAVVSTVHG
jgi:perosamine synthetase